VRLSTNGVEVSNVNAELNGIVGEILVAIGDGVAEGAELMILESMKMEIPVISATAGTVATIAVEPGRTVSKGDVLMTLDPA
jgi:acetyl-CoA carboxylase biotin carboxyl carrier protein